MLLCSFTLKHTESFGLLEKLTENNNNYNMYYYYSYVLLIPSPPVKKENKKKQQETKKIKMENIIEKLCNNNE